MALTSTERTRVRLPHVGALDGLRAMALVAVLLYHGGFSWARGGFLGVSTFFTLSGFLITSLLLVENHNEGRISLRRFWGRRARRLLPAALVTLGIVALFARIAAEPSQLTGLRGDLLSCFGLATNWRLALSGREYGAYLATSSPVQHMWSLAVEEQFYLVLPPVFFLVAKRWHRPQRPLAIIAAVAGAASTVALVTAVGNDGDTTWAYYATFTRAAEMLAGVVLACTVHHLAAWRHRRPFVVAASLLGAALTVAFWLVADQTDAWLYRGGLTVYALASVLVLVGCVQAGPLRRALSVRPMQYVGRISYGAYLYHWPVFLWLTSARLGGVGEPVLFAVRVGVTLALAAVSSALLEVPIRQRRLIPRVAPAPAAGLAFAAVALAVLVPSQAFDSGPSGIEVATGQRVAAAEPAGAVPATSPTTAATAAPVATATTVAPPKVRRLLVVGDSITRQISPYLAEGLPGVEVRWVGADGIGPLTDQGRIVPMVHDAVQATDPDVVLVEFAGSYLEHRKGDPYRLADGTEVEDGSEQMFTVWDQQVHKVLAEARAKGALVVWALVPPIDPKGYFRYLGDTVDRFNAMYRRLPGVRIVDWNRAASGPDGGFSTDLADAAGHREPARSVDGLHFTAFGYRLLVADTLDDIASYPGRILPRGADDRTPRRTQSAAGRPAP